jgi:hypothetical protein
MRNASYGLLGIVAKGFIDIFLCNDQEVKDVF